MEDDIADCKFVEDLPSEFQCKICLSVLIQPQLVNCCETCYCKSCLQKWKRTNIACPVCRSTAFSFMDMPRVSAKIRALIVHCPNAPHGCTKTMALRDCKSHLSLENFNGCEFAKLPCPYRCTEAKIFRAEIDAHCRDFCPKRPASCPHCGTDGEYEFITGEHSMKCKLYPIQCPRECGETVVRKDMPAHQSKCSLQPIPCIFKATGCDATVCRGDMDKHLQSAMGIHLTRLLSAHVTLKSDQEKKYQQLSKEYDSLQEKYEDLRQAHQSIENKMYSVGRVVEGISPQTPSTALALQQLNTMLVDISKQKIGGSFSLVLSSCAERGSHKFLVDMIHFQLDWSYVLQQLYLRLYWMPPQLSHIRQDWSCDFIMKLRPIHNEAEESPNGSITTTEKLAVICCMKPQPPVISSPTGKMVLIAPLKKKRCDFDSFSSAPLREAVLSPSSDSV